MGHDNLHEFLKKIGIQEIYGRRAPANFEDFGQEIANVVQGKAKATKTFTTETGEIITKGTPYPRDPEAINELFTMVDRYADLNKWMRKKFKEGSITVMEPIGSKGQRVVVPNGYKAKPGENVVIYDLTANVDRRTKRKLVSKEPVVHADLVEKLEGIVKTHSN